MIGKSRKRNNKKTRQNKEKYFEIFLQNQIKRKY